MEIGELLPVWSIIPFVGMLLSIAIFPLINIDFWGKHQLKIVLAWCALFLINFLFAFGWEQTAVELIDSMVLDYIPFMTLLFGLFVVSGGIHIKGKFVGNPKTNAAILFIGTILSSWIGTTGASMLLIRPIVRANLWREHRKHIVIFFIFLVANIGGCLTPIGDPPLFLGYLGGVPFFWTLEHIWPLFLLNIIILLVVFYIIDSKQLKRKDKEHLENLELQEKAESRIPFKIEGGVNFIFLAIIIGAVILNGLIPQLDAFIDPSTGKTFGIDIGFGKTLGIEYFVQIVLILLATLLSWVCT
ncbi:MAG: sodium:proton antiporter, partial [Eggerthellaceae bacterium]|nr:sodium:proton antiporter [Eggerthellaceae bacterium]